MWHALGEGRIEDAQEILERLKQEDPLSHQTRGFELELCLESNRLKDAATLARQLVKLFPQSGRIAFLAGKVAYRMRDYKQAVSHFQESQHIYPHWRTQYWLGKTLTQAGRLEEAEPLLLEAREKTSDALLDLAWLYERRNDLPAALKAYDDFLVLRPGHRLALERRLRIRARMLQPESLIEEVGTLADLGEEVPAALFPEYVQRLFDTGQTLEARGTVTEGMRTLDAKNGGRVAWICYRAKAYDLACTLFLAHLRTNLSYLKYLNALESAAAKCDRLPQVIEAYRAFAGEVPSLHGRLRKLARRLKPE
jgi:tetratricopeptide (TPR) repeat protein